MAKTTLFTVNGQPFWAPDADVSMSFEDLDGAEAGRDESGFMHRQVVRHKVGTWNFQFAAITEAQRQYMEGLFPQEGTFLFGYPDPRDASQTAYCVAYRSKYGISWRNAKTGDWRNYSFSIIEC